MMIKPNVRPWFCTLLLVMSAWCTAAADDVPLFSDDEVTFFETKIRPVLAEHCYSCHSHEAKKLKGGFYLDSRAGILKAALAEAGKPEKSLMIEAVHYSNPDSQMPPAGKLPEAVIEDLERWVQMGLPWPKEAAPGAGEKFDLDARRASHWAWQKPKLTSPLPQVAGLDASANVIDRFIETRLAKEGLKPGPVADRATLIRRVTLDLTGLSPTPQEIDAFLNDKSPNAYAKLVDRLLASPRYGEKWGRHWLDLTRYAESYGHEFDYTIPDAWHYRDYVIRALNDDVPYDRFVKEHLAGDLIEPRIHQETQVNEAIKATGWWFLHEQTHAPTDVRQHESDRIDNQIDVLSKTFLGVTVACARCHDHKFDAISDEDYYALAGYMQSSRQQIAYLDPQGKIDAKMSELRAIQSQGQREFDALKTEMRQPTKIEHDASRLLSDFNDGTFKGWYTTGWAWGDRPTVPGQWDARSAKAAAVLPGVAHSGLLGDKAVGTLRSPEFDLADKQVWVRVYGKGELRVVLDGYTVNLFNQLLYEGFKTGVDTKGKWQWVLLQDRRNLFAGKGQHRAFLEVIDDDADAFLVVDEVRLGGDKAPPENDSPLEAASVSPEKEAIFAQFTQQMLDASAKLPNPQRVLAITDGSGEDSYVHLRGSYKGVGQTMPRRLLTALGGEAMPTLAELDGSGRAQLALAVVDPSNPLTARVQVNRLWHHLFGAGIVPTVDNFGYLGLPPSHPELLDHLAVLFMQDDAWSNKAMIKRIVMSKAYQRSSDRTDPAAESMDPNDMLLHRQRIRRLTAESIRDSILFVAGSLNEKQFGPPVNVHLTEQMQGRGRPGQGPLDGQGRRSIYISVRRNFLSPMMLTFDVPIPFSTVGARNVTNVPAQSLALLNDPFVHDQADKWAAKLVKDGSASVASRIDAMVLSALGRAPTPAEREALAGFVAQQSASLNLNEQQVLTDPRPWRELCHTIFNLKGFIYVR